MATPNALFVAGAQLTADQQNNFPFGAVAASTATAGTAIVANTPLAVLTATFTVIPNRKYMVFGRVGYQALTAGGAGARALYVSASGLTTTTLHYEGPTLAQYLCSSAQGTAFFTAANFGVTSGSGTSKTVTLYFRMNNGGALNPDPDAIVGANSFPQQLIITDIGTA